MPELHALWHKLRRHRVYRDGWWSDGRRLRKCYRCYTCMRSWP